MSDNRWWKHRKKRRRDPWFSDIFDEFDHIEHMMDEMMRQAFEESPSSERRHRRVTKRGPYVYGFSMTTGPNGKPVIKEYGNLKPNRQPSAAQIREIKAEKEQAEPLIDVLEEPKTVIIVAQLPGINEEDINASITETHVAISVDTEELAYHKKLQLPTIVNPKIATTTYKNGVLQIELQKMLLTKTP